MILQALTNYYDRLEADPEEDIAPFGFVEAKISFCLILDDGGRLIQIADLQDQSGKKPRPSLKRVPDSGGRTSGVKPFFLWDKADYVFGYSPGGKPDRQREAFEAFRDLHLAQEVAIDDPAYRALCNYLRQWDPKLAAEHPLLQERWDEFATANFVFQREADIPLVHEKTAVKTAWKRFKESQASDTMGQCLVTGETTSLASLHASIKGVAGGQSSGAALVSFNADAFVSYQLKSSLNAPTSEAAAFKYTTVLNRLLARANGRCLRIGEATTVFWTEGEESFADEFGELVQGNAEDTETATQLRALLEYLGGQRAGLPEKIGDLQAPFYVLGLLPNAARIAVTFWHVSSVGGMVERLRQHYHDIRIEREYDERAKRADPLFPAPWQLLRETTRDGKDIPPLLPGGLLRAILTGGPYPGAFFQAIMRRIRADGRINYLRCAALKGCLSRDPLFLNNYTLPDMSLAPDRTDQPYVLGRLFAVFEKTQRDAQGGSLNVTLKDRFFAAASTTPASAFPRIIQLNQHHLKKLRGEKQGAAIVAEKLIGEISDKIDDFPAFQSLQEQGLFALGYYHQRNAFFRKKEVAEEPSPEN